MYTEEHIEKIFRKVESKEIKTNHFFRMVEKDKDLKDTLISMSLDLDKFYEKVNPLQRLFFIFKKSHIEFCTCNSPKKWRNYRVGYNKTCGSKKCVSDKNNESKKKFYLENLGVDHYFKTEEFKEKFRKKSLEKYGVDNPGKSEEIKNKIAETNLKKFGETSWIRVKENKEKISEVLKEKNRRDREEKIKKYDLPIEILEFTKGGLVKIHCKKCDSSSSFSNSFLNNKLSIGLNPCFSCNPPLKSESKGEIELYEFIREIYKGKIERNDRNILKGKELDIFLPEKNIAIEFNGIYYHSEIFKSKKEVLEKKNLCEKIGVNLITVWEDDWVYKKDIIKSRLNSLFGNSLRIYARNCKIVEIDYKEEREFLEKNHIHGFTPSKIRIGLEYNNKLVCLMTFGNNRRSLGKKHIEGEFELLRFCNVLGTNVLGGASKVFKHFLDRTNPTKITSYQNYSWNTGNLYEKLGFLKIKNTTQNYYWCKGNIRGNRFNFRKDKLVKEGNSSELTEAQIMTELGYYRLWDLGNIKWEFIKKTE
jgi:hypothetical protein